MKKFNVYELPKLLVSILIPLVAGFIGSIATSSSVKDWYPSLVKPFFTPPNWLFGPVWTTLYILMGVSLFLVWREGLKKENVKFAVKLFAVQLIANILWSIVFFGLKSLAGGFVVIVALWCVILFTAYKFYDISKPAAYLFAPYLAWVSIASALNLAVLLLNM